MKKITYYVVTDSNKNYEDRLFYTVCQSKKDCEEFIDLFLIQTNVEHYLKWCKLRELNSNDTTTWKMYKKFLELDKKFLIVKVKNSLNNILSTIRNVYDCPVIGCSYETEFERVKFKRK